MREAQMPRTERLFDLLNLLRDGNLHTAQVLAARLGVSERTIYRDMERLQASGVPIEGTRGAGYRANTLTTLPPIALSEHELEALNLGIAIVAQAGDARLARGAADLADKLDALLPQEGIAGAEAWKFELSPFADMARGLSHMPVLRAAITARQKVRLRYCGTDGARVSHMLRPLKLDHIARVWSVLGWSESLGDFAEFRVDLIEEATPQPELFEDEPGTCLSDFKTAQ